MKKTILFLSIFPALCFAQQPVPAKSIPFSLGNKTATVYITADKTDLRIANTGTVQFKDFPQPLETQPCVFIDPSLQFQSYIGIGGALTDASAETFARLPKEKQQEFLEACFDPVKGNGYKLVRTNIASCDFSSGSYAYVKENDKSLSSFSIDHDKQFRIPFIKAAIAAAAGNKLTMYVSPWSPPAFMKSNNDVLHGGKLLPEYMDAWANHYIKFIRAYEAQGIPIWGLSVQNEPMATQRWESCIYTAEDERDFIKKHLGPALQKAGMSNKKLIAWDHNRDLIYQRATTLLNDPEAAKYIWGIGFHWYETWTGSGMQFDNVQMVNRKYPSTNLVFTEGCVEKFQFDRIGDWALGERYGWSMINDFNSGTVGWTDWNVLLDETGGPNHAGNFCFAPIIGDTRDGSLHYTNAHYYMGHFSKFIQLQARRVAAVTTRDKLSSTAFLNRDGSLSVMVMNASDESIDYRLCIGNKAAAVQARPHSIATIVIK
jgi:glucosylceramidase